MQCEDDPVLGKYDLVIRENGIVLGYDGIHVR